MGTINAQILIGRSHPYHQGIVNISHRMFLSENGSSCWTLRKEDFYGMEQNQSIKAISWIPTLEHMLEDGILMIGLYVWQDPVLINMAEEVFQKPVDQIQNIPDSIHEADLEKLYERCRQIENSCKLAITVMNDSTINKQLSVLEKYKFETEVCTTVYSRHYSPWSGRLVIEGTLEKKESKY
jgi:hypothetical protein